MLTGKWSQPVVEQGRKQRYKKITDKWREDGNARTPNHDHGDGLDEAKPGKTATLLKGNILAVL
jgi:hypothetical protein